MSQKKASKPAKAKNTKAKKRQAPDKKQDQAPDDLSDLGGGASFEMKPFLAVILVTIACAMMLWNGFQGERTALTQQEAEPEVSEVVTEAPRQQAQSPRGAPPCVFAAILGQPLTRNLIDAIGRPYRLYEAKNRPQWGGEAARVNLGIQNGLVTEVWCG